MSKYDEKEIKFWKLLYMIAGMQFSIDDYMHVIEIMKDNYKPINISLYGVWYKEINKEYIYSNSQKVWEFTDKFIDDNGFNDE